MAQNAAEQAALEAAQAARKAARCTAVIALSRRWLLPFASCGGGSASATDGLFSRATLNSLRRYDLQLKDMFAWYSTLEEYDPTRITWNWSREHATTISSSAFILALYNFGVVPTLLSKVEALEVYVK